MPLTLAAIGEENIIKRIGGSAEVRAHLQDGRTALLARLTHGKRDER